MPEYDVKLHRDGQMWAWDLWTDADEFVARSQVTYGSKTAAVKAARKRADHDRETRDGSDEETIRL